MTTYQQVTPMVEAWIGPEPGLRSIRVELLNQDMRDAITFALTVGDFTSSELHRDATLDDLLHGNGRVHGHFGSTASEYYTHYDDEDWAVIYDSDLPGDVERGRSLVMPLVEQEQTK